MAGRGPAPTGNARQPNATRGNRSEVVVPDGDVVCPPLPTPPSWIGEEWPPSVVRWYAEWCAAEHVGSFDRTDWQRLHAIAPLVVRWWDQGQLDALKELRLHESLLGATIIDRQRGAVKKKAAKPAGQQQSADELEAKRAKREGLKKAAGG